LVAADDGAVGQGDQWAGTEHLLVGQEGALEVAPGAPWRSRAGCLARVGGGPAGPVRRSVRRWPKRRSLRVVLLKVGTCWDFVSFHAASRWSTTFLTSTLEARLGHSRTAP